MRECPEFYPSFAKILLRAPNNRDVVISPGIIWTNVVLGSREVRALSVIFRFFRFYLNRSIVRNINPEYLFSRFIFGIRRNRERKNITKKNLVSFLLFCENSRKKNKSFTLKKKRKLLLSLDTRVFREVGFKISGRKVGDRARDFPDEEHQEVRSTSSGKVFFGYLKLRKHGATQKKGK